MSTTTAEIVRVPVDPKIDARLNGLRRTCPEFRITWLTPSTCRVKKGSKTATVLLGSFAACCDVDLVELRLVVDLSNPAALPWIEPTTDCGGCWGGWAGMIMHNASVDMVREVLRKTWGAPEAEAAAAAAAAAAQEA